MKTRILRRPGRLRHQRGVSIFVVLVMVLLTTLMMLWAGRTALYNELVTGNDSDYQRALEAAHAMIKDAELDIMGQRADGQLCNTTVGFLNCRPAQSSASMLAGNVYFPKPRDRGDDSDSDIPDLRTVLAGQTPSCIKGICISDRISAQFWTLPATDPMGLQQMRNVGARYGQYTGAKDTATSGSAMGNPLLVSTSATDARAFYWVEPITFQSVGTESLVAQEYAPTGATAGGTPIGTIYRITAVAQGLKAGTQAVVQTIFVRQEASGG